MALIVPEQTFSVYSLEYEKDEMVHEPLALSLDLYVPGGSGVV